MQSVLSESQLPSPPGHYETTAALEEEKRSHARTSLTEGHTSWQRQPSIQNMACGGVIPLLVADFHLWRSSCGITELHLLAKESIVTKTGRCPEYRPRNNSCHSLMMPVRPAGLRVHHHQSPRSVRNRRHQIPLRQDCLKCCLRSQPHDGSKAENT